MVDGVLVGEGLEVGGVVVGVHAGEDLQCDGWMWLAACITHKGLQMFANVYETEALQSLMVSTNHNTEYGLEHNCATDQ